MSDFYGFCFGGTIDESDEFKCLAQVERIPSRGGQNIARHGRLSCTSHDFPHRQRIVYFKDFQTFSPFVEVTIPIGNLTELISEHCGMPTLTHGKLKIKHYVNRHHPGEIRWECGNRNFHLNWVQRLMSRDSGELCGVSWTDLKEVIYTYPDPPEFIDR